jgi:hypothetical protein
MRTKKGQLEISFGVIFSIIIIVAVLGVGFYVINHFVSLSRCATIGTFYTDLQKNIDDAWASSSSRSVFAGNLPGSVDYVCFGNLTQTVRSAGDSQRLKDLKDAYKFAESENVFLYPAKDSCNNLEKKTIKHMQTDSFFCQQVSKGSVKITISKGSTDALAKIEV